MTASSLPDACQADIHHPGDPDPVLPYLVIPDAHGSLRAEYECPCGRSWTCWWDAGAAEWPINRMEIAA